MVLWFFLFLLTSAPCIVLANLEGFYIFGDSLNDPGNNKYLLTPVQANFLPNGVDFQGGKPSGRFCNGLTVVDYIVQELGLALIPAYHDPTSKGNVILKGVNYASGGARVSNDSGGFLQNVQPVFKQLENFERTKAQMMSLLQEPKAVASHIAKSILLFAFGSNDYLNYMNNTAGKTPEQFQNKLVTAYRHYLVHVYSLGARNVVIIGLGPFGCIPSKRVGNFLGARGKECDGKLNNLALELNKALRAMVQTLNQELVGLNMLFGTPYDVFSDTVTNPTKYGFENSNSACCGVSSLKLFACLPGGSYCSKRDKYVYWDVYHPTEAANKIVAKAFLDGDTNIVYPTNIRQLAKQISA